MQSHIRKVYACLAVTCHLHFWQNDWDLLHATVVAQKVDPGEENILPPCHPAAVLAAVLLHGTTASLRREKTAERALRTVVLSGTGSL